MGSVRSLSVGALLLLGTACRFAGVPQHEKIYAAHEAGLTLIYENPQLEPTARMAERLQVRVAATKDGDAGTAIRMTYSTLKGESSALYLQKNGGLLPSQEGMATGTILLPEGFPDRVTQWEVRGTHYRVLGRATADLHGLTLPENMDRVGIWIEIQPSQAPRLRCFLLPDIGEVETLLWREGHWVSTSRLVSRGFTDVPAPRQ